MYGLKNQLCNKDIVQQQKTWGNHFWRAVLPVKTQEPVTMQAQVSPSLIPCMWEAKISLISSMSLLSGWMWHRIILACIFHSPFNSYKHLPTSNRSSRVTQIKENSSTLPAWLRFICLFQISVPHSKSCNISQVPYNVLLDWPFQGYSVLQHIVQEFYRYASLPLLLFIEKIYHGLLFLCSTILTFLNIRLSS